ncbi:hypothetical protein PtrSN002B_006047 [Pyrenophora tritici-repentis]|nr:hypothetical protein A1F99_087020 [Pyrenophora tritici-repentis]KAI1535982.1 hypothetical protein PtrSN001A_005810 [Pyrenophora tritici-repentis]KAI1550019.1 hypothetical protein PtrSN002B_006047 [Pyrenophora tritici-repentis]KAI1568229.1 hypothetical protein PtrEW4_006555 [Pyrenophora tritici-repentis]KAI1589968.1 hypothetical protein PtrEW13061_005853 [Pyrenophora tritici-repentis]
MEPTTRAILLKTSRTGSRRRASMDSKLKGNMGNTVLTPRDRAHILRLRTTRMDKLPSTAMVRLHRNITSRATTQTAAPLLTHLPRINSKATMTRTSNTEGISK